MSQLSEKLPRSMKLYREFAILTIGAVCLFVLLALLSFDPSDPLWLRAFATEHISNVVGAVGAFVAGMLLGGFGYVAYLVPIILCIYLIFLTRRDWSAYRWRDFGVCVGGFAGTTLSLCVLTDLHVNGSLAFPFGPGGIIGRSITNLTIPYMNVVGVTLVSGTFTLIFLQAMVGFSWVAVGRSLWKLAGFAGRGSAAFLRGLGTVAKSAFETSRRMALRYSSPSSKGEPREVEVVVPEAQSRSKTKYENRLDRMKNRKGRILPGGASNEELKVDVATLERRENPVGKGSDSILSNESDAAVATSLANPEAGEFELPSLELLIDSPNSRITDEEDRRELQVMAQKLTTNLNDFGVSVEVVSIVPGPVVTRFELELAPGLKVNKIISLANDLARALAVVSVRVVPVIPGKSVVGIEVPNSKRAMVSLKEILGAEAFQAATATLTLALGKSVSGEPVVANIERMPHLLVAGTTGSGKSVGINTMLLSLLYRLTPNDVKLILVDPKMLELSVYDGIPHLLAPVVTDMEDAEKALKWCVMEMERRYALMASLEVRSLAGYNQRIERAAEVGEVLIDDSAIGDVNEEPQVLEKLPLIVVVIDEFADMFMIVGKKVDTLIARIAQKARAAGIHLVLATQRPSVDVITGLIKANIPCRMSYQVSSQVDSRTILDQAGAEQLLGQGDMLYLAPGTSVPERVHGAFVSDDEVLSVVAEWKRRGEPDYVDDMFSSVSNEVSGLDFGFGDENSDDELYREAVEFVIDSRRASISSVQRKLRIGYNRAARLIETMEQNGIVSEPNHTGTREVLFENGD